MRIACVNSLELGFDRLYFRNGAESDWNFKIFVSVVEDNNVKQEIDSASGCNFCLKED